MITLNDYLYSGDTVMRILKKYKRDLGRDAAITGNEIDVIHCDFLQSIIDLLEHNEFLTAQSQKIREFYMYMAREYPWLAFTFKGRIKSLIRAEEKFNGYIVKDSYKYYMEHGEFPPVEELRKRLVKFRDLIAYRIVISMPRCHVEPGRDKAGEELKCLYEIANVLPGFLEERGFTAQMTGGVKRSNSPLLESRIRIITVTISPIRTGRSMSLCTSLSLTAAPTAIWRYRFVPRRWTIQQRSASPTTWPTRSARSGSAPPGIRFPRASASGSTRPTSGACCSSSWTCPRWT